jgi:hypothetical protein
MLGFGGDFFSQDAENLPWALDLKIHNTLERISEI